MLNLSGLLGWGFDNTFDLWILLEVREHKRPAYFLQLHLLHCTVLLVGFRLLYIVLIPANYLGESPGRVQAISWFNLLFYITSVYLKHLWVVVTLFFLDCSTIINKTINQRCD